jgi:hypothetical protein
MLAHSYLPEESVERARQRARREQAKLFQQRLLIYGDNLRVLRNEMLFRDESIDLVYLDPPFKPNEKYNVLFRAKSGTPAAAQVRAFEDSWHWDQAADAYHGSAGEKLITRSEPMVPSSGTTCLLRRARSAPRRSCPGSHP